MSVASALQLLQQAPAGAPSGGVAAAPAAAPGGVSQALALLQSAPSAAPASPKPSIADAQQLSQGATVADVPADRRSDLDRPAQENQ